MVLINSKVFYGSRSSVSLLCRYCLLQFTEEKLGQVERTDYDIQLENLIQKADRTKCWTEQILSSTEAILQPNPSKLFN
jgi:BAR domain